MMTKPPWESHQAYSGNSTTPPGKSWTMMKHNNGIAVNWTCEEQALLEKGLAIYSSEPNLSRYLKIAFALQNKTVRDVAMRCRWISNAKRRKEDHNGMGIRSRVDNKEINDMTVASNSSPLMFAQSPLLSQEHGMIGELLKQNEQFLNQISGNLKSSRLSENLTLFHQSREIIRKLLNNLNENAPELMKHMPPLPEKLKDELVDSVVTCKFEELFRNL